MRVSVRFCDPAALGWVIVCPELLPERSGLMPVGSPMMISLPRLTDRVGIPPSLSMVSLTPAALRVVRVSKRSAKVSACIFPLSAVLVELPMAVRGP